MSLSNWLLITISAISGLIQLTGLLGLLLVFFPGLTVIWVGQLIWAISVVFNKGHEPWQFGWTIALFVINTILMIGGSIIDNFFMAGNTRKKGVPWWEIAVTLVVVIIGGIFLTPIGGLALGLLVLFLLELSRLNDQKQALESTKSMMIGCGWSAVTRVFIALVMIFLWIVMLFWF